MKLKLVSVKTLKVREDTYPRSTVDWRTVLQYAEAMRAGAKFPPIVVAPIEGAMTVVDGVHRQKAMRKLKVATAQAEVLPAMSVADALLEATRLNAKHGKPLTFTDRLDVYRRLTEHGFTQSQVGEVLQARAKEIRRLAASRVAYAATGEPITLRPGASHLAGLRFSDEGEEAANRTVTTNQVHILTQVTTLLKNGWMDLKDAKVLALLLELKALLAKVRG